MGYNLATKMTIYERLKETKIKIKISARLRPTNSGKAVNTFLVFTK